MKKIKILLLISFATVTSIFNLNAQVFTGYTAFQKLIEYEGQRYLMKNIYQITANNIDKLQINKTITEIDSKEGFMFVLISYIFNDKKGIVITSFNSTNFSNTNHQFVNVHLTNNEYEKLYNMFKTLNTSSPAISEHILKKYNDRLILDVNNQGDFVFYTLWVDYHSRHTFTVSKWDRAYKKHQKFITK